MMTSPRASDYDSHQRSACGQLLEFTTLHEFIGQRRSFMSTSHSSAPICIHCAPSGEVMIIPFSDFATRSLRRRTGVYRSAQGCWKGCSRHESTQPVLVPVLFLSEDVSSAINPPCCYCCLALLGPQQRMHSSQLLSGLAQQQESS